MYKELTISKGFLSFFINPALSDFLV